MIEREVKYKLTVDLATAIKMLTNDLGSPEVETQIDIYYQHPSRDFAKTDEALRLRSVNGKVELTYKGPKLSKETKSREELTVTVNDLETADKILRRLGFTPVARIEKTRYNFTDGSFLISLDSVKELGEFIEVEGINVSEEELLNRVEKLRNKYNIFGEKIVKSYLELYLAEKAR